MNSFQIALLLAGSYSTEQRIQSSTKRMLSATSTLSSPTSSADPVRIACSWSKEQITCIGAVPNLLLIIFVAGMASASTRTER